MFTGIIEELGKIKEIKRLGDSMILNISAQKILVDINLGDSIAVNGVCLTASLIDKESFTVDVMPETMYKTSLAELKPGSIVNLERAMTADRRFGGHFVSGHIDGVAALVEKKQKDNAIYLTFKIDKKLSSYLIPKGSIAVDGVSLTIVSINTDLFTVSIIPHTLNNTNLGTKKVGQIVNIETDMIGKYIEKMISNYMNFRTKINSNITEDFLRENGF